MTTVALTIVMALLRFLFSVDHCLMDEQRVGELFESHDPSLLQLPHVSHSSLHFLLCRPAGAIVGPYTDDLVAAVNKALQFEPVADPFRAQNGKYVVDNRLPAHPRAAQGKPVISVQRTCSDTWAIISSISPCAGAA
jgi:hypothetical protein